jgi:hypothetical protein
MLPEGYQRVGPDDEGREHDSKEELFLASSPPRIPRIR